jgi:putative peptidoglycan lipid II flippase
MSSDAVAAADAAGAAADSPSAAEDLAQAAADVTSDTTDSADAKPKAKAPDLRRGSLLMASGTFVSRLTGQLRTLLMVAAIGSIGVVADAFDIGNRMPNILFTLIAAGVLQAVLIPQILKAMAADDAEDRLNKLLTVSTVGILVITIILAALTPWLVQLMTLKGDWTEANRHLAIIFAFWCVPQMFFYGLFTLLGQVLNARGQFGAFGWAPVANNIISIAGFGIFIYLFGRAPDLGINDVGGWTTAQTAWLAGTATLGIVAQAVLLFWPLWRGGFHWRLKWGLRGIGLRSASKVVGWTLGAVVLEQVGTFFLTNITSAAGQAAVQCQAEHGIAATAAESAQALAECPAVAGNAAYSQALMIYLLPHSLIIVSIITALFPRMSAAAAANDLVGVRRDVSMGIRLAGVFSVFSSVALFVLARPLTKALLPTASSEMVNVGAPVLQALSLGLVALGATVMVKRMYFAFEDGKGIFIIQIFATLSMIVVLWIITRFTHYQSWTFAAGGAYAMATWISVLLRVKGMREKLGGIDGHRILRLYIRAGISALLAALAGYGVLFLMNHATPVLSWRHSLALTAVAGTVMLIVYLAGLKVLSVSELDDALSPMLRRLRPLISKLRPA